MRTLNPISRWLSGLWLGFLLGLAVSCRNQPDFRPTVLLISLEGFRWDYQEQADTPNLDRLVATGVKAQALIPVFPTASMPNLYSLVTGLYPENHGIVSDLMYDPVFDATYDARILETVDEGRWYEGEPLWVTARKQGLNSATLFWPGSDAEIQGRQPAYVQGDADGRSRSEWVDQVLAWVDLPLDRRPAFMALSLILGDVSGRMDPHSPALSMAIQQIDSTLGQLFHGFVQRGVMEKIDIVIVSDHGMTQTDSTQVIFLDDYVELDQAGVIDWSPILGLRHDEGVQEDIYNALKGAHPHLQIYRREEVPFRLHYSNHYRIPPIVGLADVGWSITTHELYAADPAPFGTGSYGYDPRYPAMRGIFIARGPSFQNGLVVEPFQSIHIYNLITRVLGLAPAPNDGKLDSVSAMLAP